MTEAIQYEIKHKDGMLDLYSVVNTNFGGPAKNFVKSAPTASELRDYAEGQGWTALKGDE